MEQGFLKISQKSIARIFYGQNNEFFSIDFELPDLPTITNEVHTNFFNLYYKNGFDATKKYLRHNFDDKPFNCFAKNCNQKACAVVARSCCYFNSKHEFRQGYFIGGVVCRQSKCKDLVSDTILKFMKLTYNMKNSSVCVKCGKDITKLGIIHKNNFYCNLECMPK